MSDLRLTTNRLVLRPAAPADLQAIHHLHSRPEVDEFNTLGIPKDLQETEKIIEPWLLKHQGKDIKQYTFVIESADKLQFIGLIALKPGPEKYKRGEIWYKLLPEAWGKGYATEAIKRLIRFGFQELKLHRIEAGCAVANIGSIKVLEKAGLEREGRKRQVLPLKNGWSDNYEYAILDTDEWQ